MFWIACHSLLFLQAAPPPDEHAALRLHARSTKPYFTQSVTIHLDMIGSFANHERQLHLPWLHDAPAHWQWQEPIEQWVCRYAKPSSSKALTVQLAGFTLYVPWIGTTAAGQPIYRLSWNGQVDMSGNETEEALRFDHARLQWDQKMLHSNELRLQPQRWPVLDATPSGWFLGVGPFQIVAYLDKADLALGEDAELALLITGQGNLANVPLPRWADQLGWSSNRILIQTAPETWENLGQVRRLRFKLHPQSEQTAQALPPLLWSYLDPEQGRYVTQTLTLPAWTVTAPTYPLTSNTNNARLSLATDWQPRLQWIPAPQLLQDESPRFNNVLFTLWLLPFICSLLLGICIREFWMWYTGSALGWFGQSDSARFRRAQRQCRRVLANTKDCPDLADRLDRALGSYFSTLFNRAVPLQSLADLLHAFPNEQALRQLAPDLHRLQQQLDRFRFSSNHALFAQQVAELANQLPRWLASWKQDAALRQFMHMTLPNEVTP